MRRPSRRWLRVADLYRQFASAVPSDCDFSEDSASAMFRFESGQSRAPLPSNNGFAIGKKWMDVTVSMWREDIAAGLLLRRELEQAYPSWWLNNVLPVSSRGELQ